MLKVAVPRRRGGRTVWRGDLVLFGTGDAAAAEVGSAIREGRSVTSCEGEVSLLLRRG